jgi:galactose-1-phosphate uridylyltransferase
MRLPFSGRYEKLETMNRILTDAARKRAERIEELERRVAQLEWELEERVAQLKRELETAREASETAREAMERTKLLEVVAAERAQLLNEKDKQLAEVCEAATKYFFGFNSWNVPSPKLVRNNVPMDLWWGIYRRGLTRRRPRWQTGKAQNQRGGCCLRT